jgi:DNA-directed RNA polymerase subunit RPC12/RpoP
MRKDKVRARCPRCRHRQVFVKAKVNHGLHLTLSILTVGLWLVSWIAVCIGRIMRPWRCEHCGWHKPEFEPAGDSVSSEADTGSVSPRELRPSAPQVGAETSRLAP